MTKKFWLAALAATLGFASLAMAQPASMAGTVAPATALMQPILKPSRPTSASPIPKSLASDKLAPMLSSRPSPA